MIGIYFRNRKLNISISILKIGNTMISKVKCVFGVAGCSPDMSAPWKMCSVCLQCQGPSLIYQSSFRSSLRVDSSNSEDSPVAPLFFCL